MDIKNQFDKNQSLIQTVLGASPIVAAGVYGWSNLKQNAAIPNITKATTPITTLNNILSGTAARISQNELESKKARAESLRKSLLDEFSKNDTMNKLFQNVEQKNATIQSLLLTIDDPSLQMDDSARNVIKEKLINISSSTSQNDFAEEMAKTVNTIVSANDDAVLRFGKLRSEYRDVGGQLETVIAKISNKGAAYNTIPTNLSAHPLAQKHFERLQEVVKGQFEVSVRSYKEVSGEVSHVAQLYKNFGNEKKFVTSLPLNGIFFRPGETGRTLYTMPRGGLDFPRLATLGQGEALGKAYVTTPSFLIKELQSRLQSGTFNAADYNSFVREFLTNVDRVAGAPNTYGQHVLRQNIHKANKLALLNIEKVPETARAKVYAQAAVKFKKDLNPAVAAKTMLYRKGNTVMGNVGLRKDSLYYALQKTYGWAEGGENSFNRALMPLTAREYQSTNRIGAIVGGSSVKNGLTYGSLLGADIASSPFMTFASGGEGNAVVYDLGGRFSESGIAGEGISLTGRNRVTRTPLNFTIFNPDGHKYLSSSLLERLKAAGDQGIFLTPEEMAGEGLYLGETSAGAKFLKADSTTRGMWLKVNDVTDDRIGKGVKQQISLAGYEDKTVSSWKGFSMTTKGNIETVEDAFNRDPENVRNALAKTFQELGIEARSVVHTDSKTLGKSAGAMLFQLTHGAVQVSQGKITLKDLNVAAQTLAAGNGPIMGLTGLSGNQKMMTSYAHAVLNHLNKLNVSAEHIGLVMAGVYHGAEGKGTHGVNKTALLDTARALMSPERYKIFEETLNLKKALGYDLIVKGESAGEWNRARLGVEPRYARRLQERLMQYGLTGNESANVVASVYKNKVGFGAHYRLLSQMTDAMQFLTGSQTALDYDKGALRLTWNDMMKKGFLSTEDTSFASFLQSTKNGAIVDFSDAPEEVRRTIQKVFNSQELKFLGKEAFADSKGTSIKMAGETMALDGPLGKLYNSFQGRILSNLKNPKGLEESLNVWKREMVNTYSNTFTQLFSGKIAGAIAPTASAIDIVHGYGVNDATLTRARKLFVQSRTPVALQSGESYLTQLYDQVHNRTEDIESLARRTQRFFTSMEAPEKGKAFKGIYSIVSRDPILSTGNVQLAQTYRDLTEVTALGNRDIVYERIRNSQAGREMLQKHFGDNIPQSFADARFRSRQAHTFFEDFAKNISAFSSGEDAGIMRFLAARAQGEDALGSFTQAIGDFDGDHAGHVFLDRKVANQLAKNIAKDPTGYAATEFKGRLMHNKLVGQMKSAIENLVQRSGGVNTADQQLYEDILKEINLSMGTGKLDVSLRPLHEAILEFGENGAIKQYNSTFLSNLQEQFILKSKKLAKWSSVPERIQTSFSEWGTTGTQESFENVKSLMYELFDNTEIRKGITLDSKVELAGSAELQNLWSKVMGQTDFTTSYSLDDFLNTTHAAIQKSIANNSHAGMTTGRLSALIESDPLAAMNLINSVSQTQNSLPGHRKVVANIGNALEEAGSIFSHINSRGLGIAIGGIVGASALYSLMNGGISPEPIVMPGETTNNNLLNNIRNNRLFGAGDTDISPEEIASMPTQPNFNTINTPKTYINQPNSYQIRGEVSTGAGLNAFSNYYSLLTNNTGRGNININDNRRPITPNYVDRLLGEY